MDSTCHFYLFILLAGLERVLRGCLSFIYLGCAGSSLPLRLSLVAGRGLLSSCGVESSHHRGVSRCRVWALEHRLSSCGSRAWLLPGMWDHPGSGVEPVSPALAGGLFTAEPSGEPRVLF